MTTPGEQPLGLPGGSPAIHFPFSDTDANYGADGVVGQSATYLDDGSVLYAWTERYSRTSANTYGFRIAVGTCPSAGAFVTEDDSVTYSDYLVRWYDGGHELTGRPGAPTLTRRPGDSNIYLSFVLRLLEWDNSDPSPAFTWNLTTGTPSSPYGCFLLRSTDQGSTWGLVAQVEASGYPSYRTAFENCTSELFFVDSSTWVMTTNTNHGGFGDPLGCAYYRPTDSGSTWTETDFRQHGYANQSPWIGRNIAGWDDKLYSCYTTDNPSPGATNHWLTYGASDGSGTQTLYESTINTSGHLWVDRQAKAMFNVGGRLRYYCVNETAKTLEVYETNVSTPVYTDFELIYESGSLGSSLGSYFPASIIQPIGGGWAAWLGMQWVVGVPWGQTSMQAIGFSGHPMTPTVGGGTTLQALGYSQDPITPSAPGSATTSMQAIGESGQPMTPGV